MLDFIKFITQLKKIMFYFETFETVEILSAFL